MLKSKKKLIYKQHMSSSHIGKHHPFLLTCWHGAERCGLFPCQTTQSFVMSENVMSDATSGQTSMRDVCQLCFHCTPLAPCSPGSNFQPRGEISCSLLPPVFLMNVFKTVVPGKEGVGAWHSLFAIEMTTSTNIIFWICSMQLVRIKVSWTNQRWTLYKHRGDYHK